MTTNRILIAEIATAHGVKGFVKLRYFGENVADIEDYNPLFASETGEQTFTLHIKNAIKGGYVAVIDGINDRNAAELLRGQKLYISTDKLSAPEEGEYFQTDLVGCVTYDGEQEIGTVIAVENFGAGDLLEIKPANNESFYLPFKDEFVGEVDIEAKRIEVSIPDGLIDG